MLVILTELRRARAEAVAIVKSDSRSAAAVHAPSPAVPVSRFVEEEDYGSLRFERGRWQPSSDKRYQRVGQRERDRRLRR
jgi:hypothetical protein